MKRIKNSASLTAVYLGLGFCLLGCTKPTLPTGGLTSSSYTPIPFEGGVWSTGCGSLSTGGYGKIQYEFTGNIYVTYLKAYSDSSCTTQTYTLANSGTFAISNTGGTPSSSIMSGKYTTNDIDWNCGEITGVPLTTSQANSWNTSSYCGLSNWAVNVSQNINGRACSGLNMSTAGTMDYDIVRYQVTSDSYIGLLAGDLYFGLTEAATDGTTIEKRRATFNGNIIYRK